MERNPRILTELDINTTVAAFFGPIADVYLENNEWATSSGAATFDFTSSNDPYEGSVSIETTADMGASNYIEFNNGSSISAGANILKMWFKCKVAMNVAAGQLEVQLYNLGLPVGDPITLFGGPAVTYGLNGGNLLSYQEATIPFADFNYTGSYDAIRVSSGIGPSQREFFLDSIKVEAEDSNSPAKQIVVNSLDDLPLPVAGAINLKPDTKYLIGNDLNLSTNHLVMGQGTTIDSLAGNLCAVTYIGLGAAIRGTNVSCTIREINLQAAIKGFEFVGTNTESISIFQSSFSNCPQVGTVEDVAYFGYNNNTHQSNAQGIVMDNVSFFNITGNNCFSTNAGTYFDYNSGTLQGGKFNNNGLDVSVGNVGLRIDEVGITINGKVEIGSNVFQGTSTTYLQDFNPLDGVIDSYANTGINNVYDPPRLDNAGMFSISAPRTGLIIFNTDINQPAYWDGLKWIAVDGSTIFNVGFSEDFESGSLATNGWVKVDGGENDFEIGSAETNGGSFGVYVSNNGGTSAVYSSVGGGVDVSHLYIDILMPAATTDLVLQFDWKCEAEVNFDWGSVYNKPTSFTPVANTAIVGDQIGQSQYNNQSSYVTEQIALPVGQAGTTRRIIFSWRNDASVENQPPMCIDNVKILSL